MNINKAIRKQRKSYIRFLLSMCFVFFALPLAIIFYGKTDAFYLGYLAAIEALVAAAVYLRAGQERLEFNYNMGHIRVKRGIPGRTESINCNKIMYVDVEPASEKVKGFQEFGMILVSKTKFRNKKLKAVDKEILDRYKAVSGLIGKHAEDSPGEELYYLVINSGGLRKYQLLDTVFKSCVKAEYSENAIEKIKFYRKSLNS
ncbi:MAG: rane protein [Firmicutes bacterium]|nr:rane protein [Bacillota bacterium]